MGRWVSQLRTWTNPTFSCNKWNVYYLSSFLIYEEKAHNKSNIYLALWNGRKANEQFFCVLLFVGWINKVNWSQLKQKKEHMCYRQNTKMRKKRKNIFPVQWNPIQRFVENNLAGWQDLSLPDGDVLPSIPFYPLGKVRS